MTKSELVRKVAERTGDRINRTENTLVALLDTIEQALVDGDTVTFQGIGTFSVADRAERPGTNLQTGERIMVPAYKAVKFKASPQLKNAINL